MTANVVYFLLFVLNTALRIYPARRVHSCLAIENSFRMSFLRFVCSAGSRSTVLYIKVYYISSEPAACINLLLKDTDPEGSEAGAQAMRMLLLEL